MRRIFAPMLCRCYAWFLGVFLCLSVLSAYSQEQPAWEIESLSGEGGIVYDFTTATATNGVRVRYGDAVLTADTVSVDQSTGEVSASGHVRILRDDQVWVSEQVRYNFKTRRLEAQQFRTGKSPVFAAGEGLRAELRPPTLLAPLNRAAKTRVEAGIGGTIIGATPEKLRPPDLAGAATAIASGDSFPARASQVATAKSADLNGDGFTTVDELFALKQAGLTEKEMVERLEATDQVLEITPDIESRLWSNGFDREFLARINELNPVARAAARPPSRQRGPAAAAPSPMAALGAGMPSYMYSATNALVTGDDHSKPLVKLHAKSIRIIPGQKVEARDAVLYVGKVPIFYFPFYTKSLDPYANHFDFIPGYRSSFGAFLLGSYYWTANTNLDGVLHFDYRTRRGPAGGPDFNYHLGPWGDGTLRYYYAYDTNPDVGVPDANNPNNRQRVWFSYLANPATNVSVRSMVRWQGDTNIVREFFEGEYRKNPQPSTFVEANTYSDNFSLDAYVQPRVNDFLNTVERLPDIRLTGFRQQIGSSPLYYESESSAGYYRRLFAETNDTPMGLMYSAGRADTYHQIVMPETLFGWLRITPRVGGRFTYYSEASDPGATTQEQYRGVFNTGAEFAFKASRTWPGVQNKAFEIDGLRHIVEPSVNYSYVPDPSVEPGKLPQFDHELPSFRLLPLEFPDYNAIDAIDTQNVVRLGLHNRVQTKRNGQIQDAANWDLYTDWRLDRQPGQTVFADVYSDMVLRPRSWLVLESITRYDIENTEWRMAYNTLTIQPNDIWSWGLGYFYLQDDYRSEPTALGQGNNLFTSTVFFRLNENWGLRASQRFDIRAGKMQEQAYTIYRDMRSWTAALVLRLRDNITGPNDFTVAFTFSLKAFPKYAVGHDTLRKYTLWGY